MEKFAYIGVDSRLEVNRHASFFPGLVPQSKPTKKTVFKCLYLWFTFNTLLGSSKHPMELDLTDSPIDLKAITPHELEEIFEDPFAIRFLPDSDRSDGESRFYTLGRTVEDRHLFLSFWTEGKTARIYAAREMTEPELRFYQRNYGEIK